MSLPWPGGLSGLCYMFCCSFLTSCGVDESLDFHSLHLILFFGLGLAQECALLPSVRPLSFFTSGLWVDQCSCHAIPLLLPCYHLTCACWVSFGPAMYFSLIQFTLSSVFAWLILIPSWASLTHFIPLGILDPLYSFGHLWPILFLHSHGLLLRFLGFLGLITISFTFGIYWPLYQPYLLIPFFWAPLTHFCLHSISYNSHELTTSFFGHPWACFSLGNFYYLIGLWTIILAIRV